MRCPTLVALSLMACTHAACAGPLSLQDFFRGRLSAKGSVENFKDGTRRDFTMAMSASWTGSKGTLIEDVVYADGEREHKVWSFDKVSDGHFTGTREDLTRDATVVEDAEGIGMSYKANTRLPSGTHSQPGVRRQADGRFTRRGDGEERRFVPVYSGSPCDDDHHSPCGPIGQRCRAPFRGLFTELA